MDKNRTLLTSIRHQLRNPFVYSLVVAIIIWLLDAIFPALTQQVLYLLPDWPLAIYTIVGLIIVVIVQLISFQIYRHRNTFTIIAQKPNVDPNIGVYRTHRVKVFDVEWRPAVARREWQYPSPYLNADAIVAHVWLDGPHCPDCNTKLRPSNRMFYWYFTCPKCSWYIKDKRHPLELQSDAVEVYRAGIYRDVKKHEDERRLWNDYIWTDGPKGDLFRIEQSE